MLIYSLEMLSDELAERLMARKSRVTMDKLIDKRLSDEDLADLAAASSSLSQLPIAICDSPNVTVQKIRAQARTIKGMMGANRWNRQRTLPAAGKERKKQE